MKCLDVFENYTNALSRDVLMFEKSGVFVGHL